MDPREKHLRDYSQAMCSHDVEHCLTFYNPSARVTMPANKDDISGTPALREHHANLFRAFPDFSERVIKIDIAEDTIISRMEFGGTHLGVFKGMPGTGRSMKTEAVFFFTFDTENRIQTFAEYFDRSGIEEQLGIKRDPATSHFAKLMVCVNHPLVMGGAVLGTVLRMMRSEDS